MKKMAVCLRVKTVAPLAMLIGLPLLSNAAEVFPAAANALAIDTLLRHGTALQQAQSPLADMQRHTLIASDSESDPDALYVQYGEEDAAQVTGLPERGYGLRSELAISGGDYRLTPRWTAGARIGRLEQTLCFDGNDDTLDHSANLLSLYAEWFKNGFTASTLLGYAQGELESVRTLSEGGDTTQNEVDTRQQMQSVAGRYAFQNGGWQYGPFSRLDFSRSDIDGYTDIESDSTISWRSRRANSRVFSMGVHGAYVFDANNATLTPYFTLATRKELQRTRSNLDGVSSSVTSVSEISLKPARLDERWHELSCGFSMALDKRLLLTSRFEKALDLHQQDQDAVFLRADWIFQ